VAVVLDVSVTATGGESLRGQFVQLVSGNLERRLRRRAVERAKDPGEEEPSGFLKR
jgi:hypothetical protein